MYFEIQRIASLVAEAAQPHRLGFDPDFRLRQELKRVLRDVPDDAAPPELRDALLSGAIVGRQPAAGCRSFGLAHPGVPTHRGLNPLRCPAATRRLLQGARMRPFFSARGRAARGARVAAGEVRTGRRCDDNARWIPAASTRSTHSGCHSRRCRRRGLAPRYRRGRDTEGAPGRAAWSCCASAAAASSCARASTTPSAVTMAQCSAFRRIRSRSPCFLQKLFFCSAVIPRSAFSTMASAVSVMP